MTWILPYFRDPEDNSFDLGSAAGYFAGKLTLGAFIHVAENLRLMTGIDLARLNMQTNSFGLDTILRGMALGAQYRYDRIEFSLGMYHYANFTTMTALGISYRGK
ncbi:MAG: hypothetical protein U5N56_02960 [Candidatus Marinimicrobia bacterium]|nr:hypothetical protein [Candidatus Neomarinimicrobiota bacterium]